MKNYQIVFDSCTFGPNENPNFNLSFKADSAEHCQEKAIDFIESMGGKHGTIISIKEIAALPSAGQMIVGVK